MPRWFWLWCPRWLELFWVGAPIHPGPTAQLSLSLWHSWKPDSLFVIVADVHIDESGTHDCPYLIMGGVVARNGQWQEHDKRFRSLLKRNSLTYFHAKEMRHNENEFHGWSDFSKIKLTNQINRIQQKTTLFRFVTHMNKAEYEREYKAPSGLTRIQHDTQYGMCFRTSLSFVVEMLERTLETQEFEVNFILEESSYFGDAYRIHQQIKKYVPEVAKHLSTCIPVEKKRNYGVQSADAVSYAAYQHQVIGDFSDLATFEPNWHMKDAKRLTMDRSPIFRADVKADILRDMKQGKLTLQQTWKEQGDKARFARQKDGNLNVDTLKSA
jgi:Protein of unknown function (DUF3800)